FIGDSAQSLFQRRRFHDFTEDGGVWALRDAVHAADAIFRDELRNVGGDVAEITQRSGTCRNDAARDLIVGDKALFGGALVVFSDDAFVEIVNVDDIQTNIGRQFLYGDDDLFGHNAAP